MSNPKEDFEKDSLAGLKEANSKLAEKLEKINKSTHPLTQAQLYVAHQAHHIKRIADGYITLREQGMYYASSSLVRTCLESLFLLSAVRLDPIELFHVAYFEHRRDLKLVKCAFERSGGYTVNDAKDNWEKSKSVLTEIFKGTPLIEQEGLSLYTFAVRGRHEAEYNLLYRSYSNVVHATWRSAIGKFKETHQFDNISMSLCAARALFAINGYDGEPAEDFTSLSQRIEKIIEILPTL